MTDDNGCRPIAIGQPSHSGNLKIIYKIIWIKRRELWWQDWPHSFQPHCSRQLGPCTSGQESSDHRHVLSQSLHTVSHNLQHTKHTSHKSLHSKLYNFFHFSKIKKKKSASEYLYFPKFIYISVITHIYPLFNIYETDLHIHMTIQWTCIPFTIQCGKITFLSPKNFMFARFYKAVLTWK